MAHMVAIIGSTGCADGELFISGEARTSDMAESAQAVAFDLTVGYGDLASNINSAIKDAAVAACGTAGHTVGALDKKTLLGAAVGL